MAIVKEVVRNLLRHAPGPLGHVAKKILRRREELNNCYITCESANASDRRPLTGQVRIWGICYTLKSDDRVEIRIGDLAPQLVIPQVNRRDVRNSRLVVPSTGHSEYSASFDSLLLPNGQYHVIVRALSHRKVTAEASTLVDIEHESGFRSDYHRWMVDFEAPDLVRLQSVSRSLPAIPRIVAFEDRAESPDAEYVYLLESGASLSDYAFDYVREAIHEFSEADMFFGDDDELDTHGYRTNPFFKPSWSPDLQGALNYIGSFVVLSRALASNLQSGSGDFQDLMRVAADRAQKVHRIARILSHRRASPVRNRLPKDLDPPETLSVSIIIPTGGAVEMLNRNLRSLIERNRFSNFEILIVDNSRTESIRQMLAQAWESEKRIRCLDRRNEPFNYSALNNRAAAEATGDFLLFLNDDVSAASEDWLSALVQHAGRHDVGAVGAKLLFPNGLIQHAGVVLGIRGTAGHAFKDLDGLRAHYFGLSDCLREVSAVTGACLMTRRSVFHEVKGFDEDAFPVAFNDIDLCLKIGQQGYRILYNPAAVLYHHEAFSKTEQHYKPATAEIQALQERWGDLVADDPFYNPNLTRIAEDFSIRNFRRETCVP
jgi:GT2 family glycosyltransferase